MRKVAVLLLALAGFFFLVSCDKTEFTEDFQIGISSKVGGTIGGFGPHPDPNGRRDTITTYTYWEEHRLTAFLMGLSPDEISYVQVKNIPTSTIYAYSDLHMPAQYVPVVADIDINPIWREVIIAFNPGFDPHQFLSYTELEAALQAGEITVTETDNYYRYQIIGK